LVFIWNKSAVTGFKTEMTRNQIRFVVAVIVACAIRLAAQEAGDAVGWDPMECWDCTQFGLAEMYGFMFLAPIFGLIVGAMRVGATQVQDLVMLKLR
jgi:hypothetical protein